MKKCILLIISITGLFACKQGIKSTAKNVDLETSTSVKNVQNDQDIYTKYKYADFKGGNIITENSYPQGEGYTDPNGKEYFKTIFWSRITNETDKPFELKIDFPINLYELPSSIGKHFRILLPFDTMTSDKVDLANYGLTDLKSFLDSNIHKPTSIKKTVNPKESSGFYVVILFDKGFGGPFRTGLSIKGQTLSYRVSRLDSTPTHKVIDEKEINCGSINLKNLVRLK